jgi:hypothetical protein
VAASGGRERVTGMSARPKFRYQHSECIGQAGGRCGRGPAIPTRSQPRNAGTGDYGGGQATSWAGSRRTDSRRQCHQ